jgi:hypothetical protein
MIALREHRKATADRNVACRDHGTTWRASWWTTLTLTTRTCSLFDLRDRLI